MKGRTSSWKKWLSQRMVIATLPSGILMVLYSTVFLIFLFVSWFLPGSSALAKLLERCLALLTPLVAVFLQHSIRQRKQDHQDEEA